MPSGKGSYGDTKGRPPVDKKAARKAKKVDKKVAKKAVKAEKLSLKKTKKKVTKSSSYQ